MQTKLLKRNTKQQKMVYPHIFFDLDHTLWDFETNSKETLHEIYVSHELAATVTPNFELFYNHYHDHNKRLWHRYNHGLIRQDELKWKRMSNTLLEFKIGDEKLAKKLSEAYLAILPHKKALFPHTVEILEYLTNKQYKLHLITNGFEKIQWAKLENAAIDKYFTHVITSEIACSLKPHKEIFDFALNRAGSNCDESIMIGDNLDADIAGGMNAGMDTVFVNHINETTTIQPTHTVYHLKELEEIL